MTETQTPSQDATLNPVDPGMLVASAQIRITNVVTSKKSAAWWIHDVQTYAPANATKIVVALAGFTLSYDNSDHEVRSLGVTIDPTPDTGIPTEITGTFTLADKNGDDSFTGVANILVLYLAPYWT